MRFRVNPRDVPAEQIARRLGLTRAMFDERLQSLLARGFPKPDPDTGNYDLAAVDRWCDARNPHLFGNAADMLARNAGDVVGDRIAKLRGERRG